MQNILPIIEGRRNYEAIEFHHRLNPRLWDGTKLRPEIRLKIFQSAIAFYRFLKIPKLIVKDIILTGSNAGYNYTSKSDIDVHLLVDFESSECPDLMSNFFNTKKALWSQMFEGRIRGHSVELYVEDTATPVKSNSVFSILHNTWLVVPNRTIPKPDDEAIDAKVSALINEIDTLLSGQPTVVDLDQTLAKLYDLRHNGLLTGGEFSTENLTFKVLRSLGYIDRLYKKRAELENRRLSL